MRLTRLLIAFICLLVTDIYGQADAFWKPTSFEVFAKPSTLKRDVILPQKGSDVLQLEIQYDNWNTVVTEAYLLDNAHYKGSCRKLISFGKTGLVSDFGYALQFPHGTTEATIRLFAEKLDSYLRGSNRIFNGKTVAYSDSVSTVIVLTEVQPDAEVVIIKYKYLYK